MEANLKLSLMLSKLRERKPLRSLCKYRSTSDGEPVVSFKSKTDQPTLIDYAIYELYKIQQINNTFSELERSRRVGRVKSSCSSPFWNYLLEVKQQCRYMYHISRNKVQVSLSPAHTSFLSLSTWKGLSATMVDGSPFTARFSHHNAGQEVSE